MPLLLKRVIEPSGLLAVWEITEKEAWFLERLVLEETERTQVDRLKNRRRLEWLAGRWLIHLLTGEKNRIPCRIDEFGKPYLLDKKCHISISHSHGYVAVILGERALGIDIQKRVEKILRIAHKFMREEESQSLLEPTKIEHLHVYWGAKEALYKAYGRRQLDFRKHLWVKPFVYNQKGETTAKIVKEGCYADFFVTYELLGDYLLVIAQEMPKV